MRPLLELLGRAAVRPRLLYLLLRTAWRFRARDWNRRPPFLPLPPAEYLDWRMHTAYSDAGVRPPIEHVGRYLRWAVRMSRTPRTWG
ncbi:MAG TPA: hypothetical protein VF188_14815 [Longimicrobiales bacterium]